MSSKWPGTVAILCLAITKLSPDLSRLPKRGKYFEIINKIILDKKKKLYKQTEFSLLQVDIIAYFLFCVHHIHRMKWTYTFLYFTFSNRTSILAKQLPFSPQIRKKCIIWHYFKCFSFCFQKEKVWHLSTPLDIYE